MVEDKATIYDRTRMLIGSKALENLKQKKVIVFGIGGVGGFAIESLARAGVGNLTVVDFDTIDVTNINRQIIALHSTVGRLKTQVMKERIEDINPEINVVAIDKKLSETNIDEFNLSGYDYVVDAIDDREAKVKLIVRAIEKNVQIISSMGTGNKIDPSKFVITDINKTHTCPLAKIMRKKLREAGVEKVNVLFSSELPNREEFPEDGSNSPASISFVPALAGLLLASYVVKNILTK